MKKIIVLSGKQYSGKDTVAKLILDSFANFKRVGIGDAIKIAYGEKHNLTYEQIEADKHLYRNGLIELGDWGRKQDPDYWLKCIIDMKSDIIVPDVRLPHELDIFKSNDAYLIRVEANEAVRSQRGKITNANDVTECSLDTYTGWTYIINNNGDYQALKYNAEPLVKDISKYFNL